MKENLIETWKFARENQWKTLALLGVLGLLGLLGLNAKSENRLTEARMFMSDPAAQAEKCGFETIPPGVKSIEKCQLETNVTLCDGQNTWFNLSDDVCGTLPELLTYSRDYLSYNEGMGR